MLYRFCRAVSAHTGTPTTDHPRCAAAIVVVVAGVEALVAWLRQDGPAPTAADLDRLRAACEDFWPNADPALRSWGENVVSLSQFPARWEAAQALVGTDCPRELAIRVQALHPYTIAVQGWNFPTLHGQRDVSTTRKTVTEPFDLPALGPASFPKKGCSEWNNRTTRFASDPRDLIPWREVEEAYPYAYPLLHFLLTAARSNPQIAPALVAAAEELFEALPTKGQQWSAESLIFARAHITQPEILEHSLSVIFAPGCGAPEDLRIRALRRVAEQFYYPA